MSSRAGQSNYVLPVIIVACVLAMGLIHRISHPPAPPPSAPPAASQPPVAPPAPVEPVPLRQEPAPPTPPPTVVAQTAPPARPSPSGPPPLVYVGMVKVQGKTMALIEGLPGAAAVGEPLGHDGVLERIEPLQLHVKYPTGMRIVPLNIDTSRHVPPPALPPPAPYRGSGPPPPLPPPPPSWTESGPSYVVPVTPQSVGPPTIYPGSGSAR